MIAHYIPYTGSLVGLSGELVRLRVVPDGPVQRVPD